MIYGSMPGQAQGAVILDIPAGYDHVIAVGRNPGRDGPVAELGQEALERLHVLRNDLHLRIGGVGPHFRNIHPEGACAAAVRRVEFQGLLRGGGMHEEQEEHDAQRNQGDDGHRNVFFEWSDVHAFFSFLAQDYGF